MKMIGEKGKIADGNGDTLFDSNIKSNLPNIKFIITYLPIICLKLSQLIAFC
jgi:hypothetical protein